MGGSYGSGTEMQSGTATLVTGETEISVDKSYTAKIVLTDKLGNTASLRGIIPTERVTFHLRAGGKGAAFGKVAERENVLELAEDWEMQGGKKGQRPELAGHKAEDLTGEPKRIAVLDQSGVVGGRTMKALRGGGHRGISAVRRQLPLSGTAPSSPGTTSWPTRPTKETS